jgi:hypothetical protein
MRRLGGGTIWQHGALGSRTIWQHEIAKNFTICRDGVRGRSSTLAEYITSKIRESSFLQRARTRAHARAHMRMHTHAHARAPR